MISRTNIILGSLLAVVVALSAWVRVDYSKPNTEILPDMKYSPAWKAYANNPNFANGQTLQTPVVGTISRGEMPLHYRATKEDAIRAGEELHSPYDKAALAARLPTAASADKERWQESVQRGDEVYQVFCISCHGATGVGDGPVSQRGFPPPPSLLTGKSRQMKDGQLFHILTFGQSSMPSFSPQLSHARRWDVINYIRDLQHKVPETSEPKSHD